MRNVILSVIFLLATMGSVSACDFAQQLAPSCGYAPQQLIPLYSNGCVGLSTGCYGQVQIQQSYAPQSYAPALVQRQFYAPQQAIVQKQFAPAVIQKQFYAAPAAVVQKQFYAPAAVIKQQSFAYAPAAVLAPAAAVTVQQRSRGGLFRRTTETAVQVNSGAAQTNVIIGDQGRRGGIFRRR